MSNALRQKHCWCIGVTLGTGQLKPYRETIRWARADKLPMYATYDDALKAAAVMQIKEDQRLNAQPA